MLPQDLSLIPFKPNYFQKVLSNGGSLPHLALQPKT